MNGGEERWGWRTNGGGEEGWRQVEEEKELRWRGSGAAEVKKDEQLRGERGVARPRTRRD